MRGGGFSLVIIIMIVLAGIYYWSGGASPQLSTPVEVLDAMELDTEITFLNPLEADFRWNVEGEDNTIIEETITGSQISVIEQTSEQVDLIYSFLETQGFEEDIMNAADGITGSLRGFTKGDLVCTVLREVTDGAEGLEADPITYHVVVSCGVFKEEVEEVVETVGTDEEQITTLFADKYDKPADEIEIVIENRVKVFAKGSIKFAGEPGGGLWLAFNGDSGWELIFDGNGSVACADIEGYEFPTDMVSECTDTEGALIVLT